MRLARRASIRGGRRGPGRGPGGSAIRKAPVASGAAQQRPQRGRCRRPPGRGIPGGLAGRPVPLGGAGRIDGDDHPGECGAQLRQALLGCLRASTVPLPCRPVLVGEHGGGVVDRAGLEQCRSAGLPRGEGGGQYLSAAARAIPIRPAAMPRDRCSATPTSSGAKELPRLVRSGFGTGSRDRRRSQLGQQPGLPSGGPRGHRSNPTMASISVASSSQAGSAVPVSSSNARNPDGSQAPYGSGTCRTSGLSGPGTSPVGRSATARPTRPSSNPRPSSNAGSSSNAGWGTHKSTCEGAPP